MKEITLKSVAREMFVDTDLVLGRDCGDFTLTCPFCGHEWARINERGYVDPYHLVNALRVETEDRGWYDGPCCYEKEQWEVNHLFPAKWRAWRHCTGCPEEVTPRKFLMECDDPFTVPCPPDRDEHWWRGEVEEASLSRSNVRQLANQLLWHMLHDVPDTRLYFNGLVMDADGYFTPFFDECGLRTRRWWDNKPEPFPSEAFERAVEMARKKLNGITTLKAFKDFLRPKTIPDFGPAASEIQRLYEVLEPRNRWMIFGDRDPVSFFDCI